MSQVHSTSATSVTGSEPVAAHNGDQAIERSLTVVVPMFDEKDCVVYLIETLVEMEIELGERYAFEFLLIDDGSGDGTGDLVEEAIAERANYRVIRHSRNRGIAAAIHTGLRHARHEVVVSIDADGSYDAMLIAELVPLLTPDVDLVTASPYHPAGSVENVPWWRLWLSRRASGLYRMAMQQKLACYTSCYRVYRRSRVVDLEPDNAGYVGVAELVWKLDRQGCRIVEHPATLRTRVAGHSKMRVFRSALRHLHLVSDMVRDRLIRKIRRSKPDGQNS